LQREEKKRPASGLGEKRGGNVSLLKPEGGVEKLLSLFPSYCKEREKGKRVFTQKLY